MNAAAGPKGRAGMAAATALLLAACAGTPPAGAPPAGPSPFTPAPERASPRDVERRWLQSWFEGTPVAIASAGDGGLRVSVPREFSFDKGQAAVKPPLAAVLDKVAESLRRRPQAQLEGLAAPPDEVGDEALARRRAAAVRQHLRTRGVPEARLAAPAVSTAAAVQLRLALPAR